MFVTDVSCCLNGPWQGTSQRKYSCQRHKAVTLQVMLSQSTIPKYNCHNLMCSSYTSFDFSTAN